jgi:hypothetical protein
MQAEQVSPSPKLHQQLNGIKSVEIDHAKEIAFAWYGGAEILAICCSSGRILQHHLLSDLGVVWTLDLAELKIRVDAALLNLNSEPDYFANRLSSSSNKSFTTINPTSM